MSQYIITMKGHKEEIVCHTRDGAPSLVSLDKAKEYLEKYKLEFSQHIYRVLRVDESL